MSIRQNAKFWMEVDGGHEYALKTDIDSSVHMTVIDVDAEGAIVKISEYQP